MNRASKAVATGRALPDGTWSNSERVDGDPVDWVRRTIPSRDVVVIGSGSVADTLAAAGVVDEYRLLTFPVAVGEGRRLFRGGETLALRSAERVGPAVLAVYDVRA